MVSIIVCAKNKLKDLTIPCIQRIHATVKVPFELIGVDDGSRDGTLDFMRTACHKSLRTAGKGPGPARNAGMMCAAGDHIMFLDNDVMLHQPGWLGVLLSESSKVNVGIAGPVLSNERIAGDYPAAADGLIDVPCISGACFLFPRSTFNRLGMLDPEFARRGEDTDYCFRAKLSGLRVVITPKLHIRHLNHGTFDWTKEHGQLRKFREKYKHFTHMFPV